MRHYLMDGHTHTLASGHAYNTLEELVETAKIRGLECFCLTEHGPAMPGSCGAIYFGNYRILPPVIGGVRVICGIEANIMDYEGTLDVPERYIDVMEVISASLHIVCLNPGTKTQNTEAVLGAIDNPSVDVLCHLGDPRYVLDYEAILQAAKQKDKLIEINNGSFFIRKGSAQNCVAIAKRCGELDIPIIVGSDTHYREDLGNFPYADHCLNLANVPDELIVNLRPKMFMDMLRRHGKKMRQNIRRPVDELF